jgi:hypothetical protein
VIPVLFIPMFHSLFTTVGSFVFCFFYISLSFPVVLTFVLPSHLPHLVAYLHSVPFLPSSLSCAQ